MQTLEAFIAFNYLFINDEFKKPIVIFKRPKGDVLVFDRHVEMEV